ncbi:uncharacterized protein LOC113796041 isoform X3 [Dermatophagoides pteronyssinus]
MNKCLILDENYHNHQQHHQRHYNQQQQQSHNQQNHHHHSSINNHDHHQNHHHNNNDQQRRRQQEEEEKDQRHQQQQHKEAEIETRQQQHQRRRRREQENHCENSEKDSEDEGNYIEELAELISAAGNFNEMNSLSVKPDKCAILQETVKQIQNINKQNLTTDDLQASEVSSSKPNILPPDLNSLLLDALDCFLFTLNADGYVEYISENVNQYLKFTQSEVINKSIFDILHPDDHPRFNALLLPMAIGNNGRRLSLNNNNVNNSQCWPSSTTANNNINSGTNNNSNSSSSLLDQSQLIRNNNNNNNENSSSTLTTFSTNSFSSSSLNQNLSTTSSNNTSTSLSSNQSHQQQNSIHLTGNLATSGTTNVSSGSTNQSANQSSSSLNPNTCSGSTSSSSSSSSSLIGTLTSLNQSSNHNEFNSFNSRFLVKSEGLMHSSENDDDDYGDENFGDDELSTRDNDDFLDSLNFDDNEALAQNDDSSVLDSDLAAVLDAAQAESSSSSTMSMAKLNHSNQVIAKQKQRLLLLKQQKRKQKLQQKESSNLESCLPQYELMQVNTKFISNSESKQIDSLSTTLSLNNSTFVGFSSPGTAGGHQMTEDSRVLCVARRLPNSEQQSSGNSGQTKCQIKHFSTRLDMYGCVTHVDWSTLSSNNIQIQRQISHLQNNLKANRLFHDSVHKDDLNKVQQHLKDAIINAGGSSPAAVSKSYRLKVGPDQYAKVLTKTKLLKNNFMMSKHTIFFEQNSLSPVKKEEDDQSIIENRSNTNLSGNFNNVGGNHNIGSSPAATQVSNEQPNRTTSSNDSLQQTTSSSSQSMSTTNNPQQHDSSTTQQNLHQQHQFSSSTASTSGLSACVTSSGMLNSNHQITTNPMMQNHQWSNNQFQQPQAPPDLSSSSSSSMQMQQSNVAYSSASQFNNPLTTLTSSASSSSTAVSATPTVIDLNLDDFDEMFSNRWEFSDTNPSSNAMIRQQEEPTTTVENIALSSSSLSFSSSLVNPRQIYTSVPFTSSMSMMINTSAANGNPQQMTMISSQPQMFSSSNSTIGGNNSVQQGITVQSSFGIGQLGQNNQQQMIMTSANNSDQQQHRVIMDDKLRNLLTSGPNSSLGIGTLDNDQVSEFSSNDNNILSHQNNKNNKTSSVQHSSNNSNSSDNILRELLDNADDLNIGAGDLTGDIRTSSNDESESTLSHLSGCNSSSTTTTNTASIGSASSFVDLLNDTKSMIVKSSNQLTMTTATNTTASSSSNNMLRMLLNDDDCVKSTTNQSTRGMKLANVNKNSQNDVLVEHLLKDQQHLPQDSSNTTPGNNQKSTFELNSLLSSNNENGCAMQQQQQQYNFNLNKRKSPFDQNEVYQMQDSESKRMAIGLANITTSTSSNSVGVVNNTKTTHKLLAYQNPMLASMLAKTPTSLPEEKIQTIPPSMISSTPDIKLPPNLDKKIIPTPPTTGTNTIQSTQQIQQTHSNQHQQHHITLHQANSMQQQQPIQNIQLQIQQHAQQQQHLITTIVPGSSTSMVSAPIAIKSGQQQQQIYHTNQSQLQQQIKQQQQIAAGGNLVQRLQLRQQQINNNSDLQQLLQQQLQQQQQQQQQPVLQPQTTMSVGQQIVQQQQLQLKQQQQQQQQTGTGQQATNFLTQILTTASNNPQPTSNNVLGSANNCGTMVGNTMISKGGMLTLTATTNQCVTMLRNVSKIQQQQGATMTIQPQSVTQQQPIGVGFIHTLSGGQQQLSSQQHAIVTHQQQISTNPQQQITTTAPVIASQSNHHNLAPNNSNNNAGLMNDSIDLEDPALISQILDEVIELQDDTMIGVNASSTSLIVNNVNQLNNNPNNNGAVGVGNVMNINNQPSLSSLLSNTANMANVSGGNACNITTTVNRRINNDIGLIASGLADSTGSLTQVNSITTNEQQAISEIRKELMKVENQQNVNTANHQIFSSNNSQPPTPQSPMLTNVIGSQSSIQQQHSVLSAGQQQQVPPPNYQPPPSYPQVSNTFINNNPQPSISSQVNRVMSQSSATMQQLMQQQRANVSMMNSRIGQQQQSNAAVMQRVAAMQQVSGTGNTYLVGPTTTATNTGQQQQIQFVRMSKGAVNSGLTGTQSIVLGQGPPNLNVAHKRLLMHQEQQDFNVKPSDGGFDINGLNSINNTVAPNVQITVKPRQAMPSQQQATAQQDIIVTQMSPRYVIGSNNNTSGNIQVPSTPPILPQSPVPGSTQVLSPSPVQGPTSTGVVSRGNNNGPVSYNHSVSYTTSPQTTLATASCGNGQQVPSPFSSTNHMSPGHFVTGNSNMTTSASPSPAPPQSPMLVPSPQSVNNQPITQISWQQQASPAASAPNRISSGNHNVPSPAQQVLSPSGPPTMPKSPVTAPNLVSIQQQTNPMLNAQLSSVGLQRFSRSTRPQGPRFFPSRQGQFSMQATAVQQQPQNNGDLTQQFISQQNHHQQQQQQPMTISNIPHLVQPRRLTLRMPIQTQQIQQQQQQSFTINTQTNVKLSIQSQQQITASVVDNSFVGISGANNGNKISPTSAMFSQQQPQISQQINLNDLSGFDNHDGLVNVTSSGNNVLSINDNRLSTQSNTKPTSDYVKQKLNSFVSERSSNVQQQQHQVILQQQQSQTSVPTSQQQILIQQPNTPQQSTPNNSTSLSMEEASYVEFEDSFFDQFVETSNSATTNSINMVTITGNQLTQGQQIVGTNNDSTIGRSNSMENDQNQGSSLLQQLLSHDSGNS